MTFDRPLALRLLGISAGAGGAGVAAGFLTGIALFGMWFSGSSHPSDDPWEGFAVALVVIGIGLLAAAVTYTAALVVGVRRHLPEGRRVRTGLALWFAPPVVMTGASLLASGASGQTSSALASLGSVVWAAVVVVGVLAMAGALDGPSAVRAGAAGVVLAGVLGTGAAVLGSSAQRAELVERYRRSEAPLALVDGQWLAGPSPNWSVIYVVDPAVYADRAAVSFRSSDGRYGILELTPEPAGPCPPAWRCRSVGESAHGTVWESSSVALGQLAEVWVETDGGRWIVDAGAGSMTESEALDLLHRLQPVDAERFAAAAHPF